MTLTRASLPPHRQPQDVVAAFRPGLVDGMAFDRTTVAEPLNEDTRGYRGVVTPHPRHPSTIAAPVEHEFVVKKSRFLGHAFPLARPEDAEERIAATRKRYWDASHNCLALVTGLWGEQARSSDDGEPSGTAGAPILEVLRRRELTDTLVIVTRYFGGVKLGAGGLVRAYSSAASEVLDRAAIVRRTVLAHATLAVSHAEAGRIDHVLRDWASRHDAHLGETTYAHETTFEIWLPPHTAERLTADIAAVSAGGLAPIFGEHRVIDVPA